MKLLALLAACSHAAPARAPSPGVPAQYYPWQWVRPAVLCAGDGPLLTPDGWWCP